MTVTLADGTVVPANDPRAQALLGQQRDVIVVNPPPPPPVQNQPEVLTREQMIEAVEAARKEEKDKLYETLNTLNGRVKVFEDERQRLADEAAEAQRQVEEAERLKQQEEATLTERYQQLEQTWQQRYDEQDQRIQAQQALFEKEREFQQLANYRNQRLGELKDAIDPRFHDFISGTTPEEIEASLFVAAEKTAAIGQEFQTWAEQQGIVQGAQQRQQVRTPGVPVTSGPAFTPEQLSGGAQERTLTPEDIANMPMSEFAANRESLLAAASRQVQERGLYG
jgi:hypothetical protein